jgi:hypothetical protein
MAIEHGTVASAKLVSGVVAVPFIIAGSTGEASTAIGKSLLELAVDDGPLEITEKTVTADVSPQLIMNNEKSDNLL